MNVVRDEWSGLFKSLQERVSERGSRRLLNVCIQDIQNITMDNFGVGGVARPQAWRQLNAKYAKRYHDGDRTPTLVLSGHMLASFKKTVTDTTAKLTNIADYADEHLPLTYAENKSSTIPARPYYPVILDGTSLTEFALNRQREILNLHFQV